MFANFIDRLRKFLLYFVLDKGIHTPFFYEMLSVLPFSRFGKLKRKIGKFRSRIAPEEIRKIVEAEQCGAEIKTNFLCDEFNGSAIKEEELTFLTNMIMADDEAVRDKAMSLIIEYGRQDISAQKLLLSKLKLSINELQSKAIMLVFTHLTSFEPLSHIDRELVDLLLQRIHQPYNPYEMSSVPTAQGLLTALVAENKTLMPLLFEAFEKSDKEQERGQYLIAIQSIGIRNGRFKREIADWIIRNRELVPNFQEALDGLESRIDPRIVAMPVPTSKIGRTHGLILYLKFGILSTYSARMWGFHLSWNQISSISVLSIHQQHVSEMLDLALRNSIFLAGLVVAVLIFALREQYLRFGSDILRAFLTHGVRLIILGVIFFSFIITGASLAFYYQGSTLPDSLIEFSMISIFLSPILFIMWCISVVNSLRPTIAVKEYVLSRMRLVRYLSRSEGIITKRLVGFKRTRLGLKFVFDGVVPNPSRNQSAVTASRDGVVVGLNLNVVKRIHSSLVSANEGFEKCGTEYLSSELQLHRRIGVAVHKGELLATLYTDDIKLIRQFERYSESIFQVGLENQYRKFKQYTDTIFLALTKSVEAGDVQVHGFLLSVLASIFVEVIDGKSGYFRGREERLEPRPSFSFLHDNEATFMEVYLSRALSNYLKTLFTANNINLSDQFLDFLKEVIRVSQLYEFYTTIPLLLSSLRDAQNWIIESKQYRALRILLIHRAQLASVCYASDDDGHDTFLRLDFQDALSKIFSLIDEDPEIRKHLDNYFTSYEILVCYMLVTRYFNAEKVSRCFKWIRGAIEQNKTHRSITFFGTRTLYMIGALCLARERFHLASEAAKYLLEIENLAGNKIDFIVEHMTKNKYDLGFRNDLWGDLFNPASISADIKNYELFLDSFRA